MIKDFKSKYWNDPVWSKIISALFLFVCTLIYNIFSKKKLSFDFFLVFILVAIILVLLFVIRHKNSVIRYLNYYDRKNSFLKIHMKFFMNEKGNLDVIHSAERKIECLNGEIKYFILGPGSDLGIYERSFVKIPEASIKGPSNNSLIYKDLEKNSGSNLKYRFDLLKPLFKGDTIHFEYKHEIANFKIGTKANIIEKQDRFDNSMNRSYEYSKFTINYPTDEFIYILEFDKNCGVENVEFETLRNQTVYSEFYEKIKNSVVKKYNKNSIEFSITIKKPPLKTAYRWQWIPSKN